MACGEKLGLASLCPQVFSPLVSLPSAAPLSGPLSLFPTSAAPAACIWAACPFSARARQNSPRPCIPVDSSLCSAHPQPTQLRHCLGISPPPTAAACPMRCRPPSTRAPTWNPPCCTLCSSRSPCCSSGPRLLSCPAVQLHTGNHASKAEHSQMKPSLVLLQACNEYKVSICKYLQKWEG